MIQGARFKVWGSGFGIWGLGVSKIRSRVMISGFGSHKLGLGFWCVWLRVHGRGLRVTGEGLRVKG
jgi:hypothetical protein